MTPRMSSLSHKLPSTYNTLTTACSDPHKLNGCTWVRLLCPLPLALWSPGRRVHMDTPLPPWAVVIMLARACTPQGPGTLQAGKLGQFSFLRLCLVLISLSPPLNKANLRFPQGSPSCLLTAPVCLLQTLWQRVRQQMPAAAGGQLHRGSCWGTLTIPAAQKAEAGNQMLTASLVRPCLEKKIPCQGLEKFSVVKLLCSMHQALVSAPGMQQ